MSNWSSTQLTDLGRALDAKVTAGTTLLSFTKMKLGSGTETAEDIPAMTDLVSPKLVLGISRCAVSASDDTICELISVASSSDVEESFVVRELGVFATDPDAGEILYAVMLDSTPDTMPNENVSSPVTVTYQVNIVSANASSITAVIDPTGLVTASVLQAHNDSISAHKMAHWYRQNSKAYAVGDIAFSASLPSSLVLECTTAGTTAATAPDFSGAVEGDTIADGTVVWTYKNILSGGGGGGGFNTREEITTSGTWTAPVTGTYRVTCIGGGGAGGNGGIYMQGGKSGTQGGTTSFGGYVSAAGGHSGGGGGESAAGGGGAAGAVVTDYISLTAGDVISITVGAGGVAPTSGTSGSVVGENGSGGAEGGALSHGGQGALSDYGSGNTGGNYILVSSAVYLSIATGTGGSNGTNYGGGGGGAISNYTAYAPNMYSACGGGNGQAGTTYSASGTYMKGGDGGNGAVIIEYFKKEEE